MEDKKKSRFVSTASEKAITRSQLSACSNYGISSVAGGGSTLRDAFPPRDAEGSFYQGPDVSRAMVMGPPIQGISNHITEQTRTNMSQPSRGPGTVLGDEQHFLQALWSKKDI